MPQYDSSNSVFSSGLANPKSANFICIYSLMSMFANLRSRCTTFFKRNIFMASINWRMMGLASASLNLFLTEFFLMYFSKSPKLQYSMIILMQSLPNWTSFNSTMFLCLMHCMILISYWKSSIIFFLCGPSSISVLIYFIATISLVYMFYPW